MAMAMGGGGASGPQMNVTPLIDVLLVLIILFMVIVAEQKPEYKGLKAQVPQPASKSDSAPQPEGTIVIQLAEQTTADKPALRINQQPVAWIELQGRLRNIFKQRAQKIAFVQGEDGVDFEYVADVIDTAREAGVQRVGLLPKEMAAVH